MDLKLRCNASEAKEIAAASMHTQADQVASLVTGDTFFVFGHMVGQKQQVRLVDHRGFVKVQCGDAAADTCQAKDWEGKVTELWNRMLTYKGRNGSYPQSVSVHWR